MVNLRILKKRGCTVEAIREMATKCRPQMVEENTASRQSPEDQDSAEGKFKVFQNRVFMRINSGRDYMVHNWKDYHAMDLAWDAPFKQVNPTLLHSLLDADPSKPEVENALKSWGFDVDAVTESVPDPKNPNVMIKRINVPAFWQVIVPLVRAYVSIRRAKIMNDRRRTPFIPYDPVVSTVITRLMCETIAHRVEVMGQQLGYFEAVNQAVFGMLIYTTSIIFPCEEWYAEAQEVDSADAAHYSEGEGDEKRHYRIVKEGIRYIVPHPAKTYYNRAYRASTINTDSGVDWLMHMQVKPCKAIQETEGYWNTDVISWGAVDWWTGASSYFDAIYGGCVMNFPQIGAGGSGAPVGNDNEVNNATRFYSSAHDDRSCTLTEYFEKAVPKDIGIGDYDCPVWFRIVVAGDGTIVYMAPTGYRPCTWFGYDVDDNREKNASLALEILPFQDHFSNLMSQYLLSIKQNLANVNFYDEDVVNGDDVTRLMNLGEKTYRALNWIRYSGHKLKKALFGSTTSGVEKVFHSQRFTPLDTNGQIQAMRMVLEILERVLTMSAAEAGQAASHELRKDEVQTINNSSSNRLRFTGIPVDDGIDAMAVQLYEALINHGEADFWVAVSQNEQITAELLEELGFYPPDKTELLDKTDRKFRLKVKKLDSLMIDAFAGHRDSTDRANNVQVATALAQMLASWFSNPVMLEAVGTDQIVELLNQINRLAGMPNDFVLRAKKVQSAQDIEQLKQEFAAALQAAVGSLKQDVAGGMSNMLQQTEQRLMAIEGALQNLLPPASMPGPDGVNAPIDANVQGVPKETFVQ